MISDYEDESELIELMGNTEIFIHVAVANKLKVRGSPQPFLTGLKHENRNVRLVSAHWLMSFKDKHVVDALLKSCADSYEHVRMWSAFSLGEIGNSVALPKLNEMKSDKSPIVVDEVEKAIKKIVAK